MIRINGEDKELNEKNLMELLKSLNYRVDRVAVELNGNVIKKSQYESTTLADGDKVEIVCFVGGG